LEPQLLIQGAVQLLLQMAAAVAVFVVVFSVTGRGARRFCGRPTVCSHLEIDSKGHFTVSTLSSEKKQYVGKGSGASVTPCRRGGWDPLVPTDTRRWPELARGTGPKSAITMLGFDVCDGIGLRCKWGVQSKNIM